MTRDAEVQTSDVRPEDCPEPGWHETHHYCPACSWVNPDAPKSPSELPLVEHMHTTDQGWLCPDSGHFVVEGHFLDNRCPFRKDKHRKAIRVFLIYAEEADGR